MINLREAFRLLNELESADSKREVIQIDVIVEEDLTEDRLPSNVASYDEQMLEDWYDFASNVETIIEHYCDLENISLSKNPESLSEYFDFYALDENGNRKNYLINLRLSNHRAGHNARELRKKKAEKINPNYKLKSIIVNNNQFKSYNDALTYLRKLLAEESF